MSLMDDLYTKREYLADLAECDAVLRAGREAVCDKRISGYQFETIVVPRVEATRKMVKARWAVNAKWFGALRKAKHDWAMRVFGEHDADALRKLAFLRAVVAKILEGMPRATPVEESEVPSGVVWCRERLSNRSFMPDCDYEICTGGKWHPVQRDQLPDRVRWV